jgi:Protein of unknown function DUF262
MNWLQGGCAGHQDDRPRVEVWKIRELLRDERLRIPDYQRPYAWSTQNVAELVDDIRQFTPSGDYRIGTVILHGNDDHGEQVLDVVDGQQRLTTLHLLAWALRATGSDPTARDVARLRLSPFGAEQTASRARKNAAFLARLVSEWEPDAAQEFANAVFLQCEVVVVTLASLDEAFQMFDSQNARGRALYPTDLLKAFHLREIGSGLRDAATKREVVELWEDIPAAHVNALFSEYLFKIRRWSGGRDVPKEGFTTSDIGMFKGIRERDVTNSENNWARPFVYAKNFTDDYRSENSTLVRAADLRVTGDRIRPQGREPGRTERVQVPVGAAHVGDAAADSRLAAVRHVDHQWRRGSPRRRDGGRRGDSKDAVDIRGVQRAVARVGCDRLTAGSLG